jgi:hypothetical protein
LKTILGIRKSLEQNKQIDLKRKKNMYLNDAARFPIMRPLRSLHLRLIHRIIILFLFINLLHERDIGRNRCKKIA